MKQLEAKGYALFYNDEPLTIERMEGLIAANKEIGHKSSFYNRVARIDANLLPDKNGVVYQNYSDLAAHRDAMLQMDYPIIIKSSHGYGGYGALVVKTPEQLDLALRIIDSPEFSLRSEHNEDVRKDTFIVEHFHEHARHFAANVDLRHPDKIYINEEIVSEVFNLGNQSPQDLRPEEKTQIEKFIARFIETLDQDGLNYGGYLNFDFISLDGKVKAIEANPRMSGSLFMNLSSGKPFSSGQYFYKGNSNYSGKDFFDHIKDSLFRPNGDGKGMVLSYISQPPGEVEPSFMVVNYADTPEQAKAGLKEKFGKESGFVPRVDDKPAFPGYSRGMSHYLRSIPGLMAEYLPEMQPEGEVKDGNPLLDADLHYSMPPLESLTHLQSLGVVNPLSPMQALSS